MDTIHGVPTKMANSMDVAIRIIGGIVVPVIFLIISGAMVIIALTMAMNLLIFPRLGEDEIPIAKPFVSILIPARNEADVIACTVRHHLAQKYQNFELLILDDHSEDSTGEIALEAGSGDERLRIIPGIDLPDGWMGKSWACQRLGEMAKGDILIFTDADVRWNADALNSVIARMEQSGVDMLTVWSTQITKTLAERLTVPLMAQVILGYLPVFMVHHSPFSLFAAANGQVMAWRRDAYEAIGGHRVVANQVLDDVRLAKEAKKQGFRMLMVDGNRHILTRMYTNWQSVRNGFAKNILAGYGGVFPLLLGTIFHWMLFLFPYALLLIPGYRLEGFILILAGFSLRAISAYFTRQRIVDTIGMPATVILFTIIAFQSIYWHFSGGVMWKGRKLRG